MQRERDIIIFVRVEEPDLLHDLPVCLMVGLRLSYLGAPKINFLGQDPGSWVKSPGGCWVRGGSWGVLGKEGFLKGEGGLRLLVGWCLNQRGRLG